MQGNSEERRIGCAECADQEALGFDFSMALQPIVNTTSGTVFAQEALVRGTNGESASEVFRHVNDANRYRFDQACRVKAIELAAELKITSLLSINFMPNAVYQPERCIRTTLDAAQRFDFPIEQIIFEVTESERVDDHSHLRNIIQHYQSLGFKTAIDDFGAGYSGLNLLAEMQTDLIKLDLGLVRNIHQDKARQAIIRGTTQVCRDLGIAVIAEGIECREELEVLQSFGIELFQGFYFARPAYRATASISEGTL